jgi:hypothetical protein
MGKLATCRHCAEAGERAEKVRRRSLDRLNASTVHMIKQKKALPAGAMLVAGTQKALPQYLH